MPLLCRSCEIHRCRRGEDSCAPTVAPAGKLVACSSELRWVFFKGPVHRYKAGSRVHRDTAPIVRCKQLLCMDTHISSITSAPQPQQPPQPPQRPPRAWGPDLQKTAEVSAVAVHGVTGLVFRAVYTGTRPGGSPAIRAGKGWRGRRELAPRCSATQLGACSCVHIDRDMFRCTIVRTTTTTRRLTQTRVSFSCCVTVMFRNSADVFCADRALGSFGSAKRRRERRLRAMLRHERQTVAMALAEKLHHSSRGQKMPRAGREARDALHGHVPEAPLPQGRVLRHVVGHLPVPALDVPVPQMVDQLPNVVQFLAAQLLVVPEPVIEVTKILPHDIPPRRWCRDTQLVEQLVEVPADCGAARRHSSSWWWWRTKFWSSRFFLWTAFNSVAFQETHF